MCACDQSLCTGRRRRASIPRMRPTRHARYEFADAGCPTVQVVFGPFGIRWGKAVRA